MKLKGKTALITGASRGIGRAIAARLAADGARVIITYASNKAEAESAVAEIAANGGEALMFQADVADLDSIARLFEQVREAVSTLDILVNNAGRGAGFPSFLDVTPEQYDSVFALNTRGLFFVTQAAVKIMNDNGRVIVISSMSARIRMPGLHTYASSKAAADAFTRNLSMELAPRGITMNSINSGIVETDMTTNLEPERRAHLVSMIPMGRIGQVRDIADIAAFLASDDSRWITGEAIAASGGRYT